MSKRGGREEALLVQVEEEGGVLGIWDSDSSSQTGWQPVAYRDVGDVLLGRPGHGHRDLASLAAIVREQPPESGVAGRRG